VLPLDAAPPAFREWAQVGAGSGGREVVQPFELRFQFGVLQEAFGHRVLMKPPLPNAHYQYGSSKPRQNEPIGDGHARELDRNDE